MGAYFPSMASLKGKLFQDGSRGRIYGILRLPLNLFVIAAHSLAEEGMYQKSHVCLNLTNTIQATNIETMCS